MAIIHNLKYSHSLICAFTMHSHLLKEGIGFRFTEIKIGGVVNLMRFN